MNHRFHPLLETPEVNLNSTPHRLNGRYRL